MIENEKLCYKSNKEFKIQHRLGLRIIPHQECSPRLFLTFFFIHLLMYVYRFAIDMHLSFLYFLRLIFLRIVPYEELPHFFLGDFKNWFFWKSSFWNMLHSFTVGHHSLLIFSSHTVKCVQPSEAWLWYQLK